MAHFWVAVGNDHETVDQIIERWKAEEIKLGRLSNLKLK